jgi:hypothetical protein
VGIARTFKPVPSLQATNTVAVTSLLPSLNLSITEVQPRFFPIKHERTAL